MKNIERIETLNKIYKPLIKKAEKLYNLLNNNISGVKLSFYNGHYTGVGKKFVYEYYPLPVVEICNKFTFVVDFNNINFECFYEKQFILNLTEDTFNFLIKRNFACYPFENCLLDIYKKDLSFNSFKQAIITSNYKQFAINFKLNKNYNTEIDFVLNNLIVK